MTPRYEEMTRRAAGERLKRRELPPEGRFWWIPLGLGAALMYAIPYHVLPWAWPSPWKVYLLVNLPGGAASCLLVIGLVNLFAYIGEIDRSFRPRSE